MKYLLSDEKGVIKISQKIQVTVYKQQIDY